MTAENRKLKWKNFKENINKNLKENTQLLDLNPWILGLFGVPLMELPQSLVRRAH